MYSFSYLEPVCCSMSSSNCCFLTLINVSQEAGQMVWYSHLFQNFPQFIVIHTVKGFGIVNKAEIDVFICKYSHKNYIINIKYYTYCTTSYFVYAFHFIFILSLSPCCYCFLFCFFLFNLDWMDKIPDIPCLSSSGLKDAKFVSVILLV